MSDKNANFASRKETIQKVITKLNEEIPTLQKHHFSCLKQIEKLQKAKKLNSDETLIFSEVWRQFSRSKKLPSVFVRELTQICAISESVWVEARKENNFKMFLPYLEKIVALKRKEAQLVGFTKSPYDALLDEYEPQMTSEEVSIIFYELKIFLIDYVKKITKSKIKLSPTFLFTQLK